MFIQLYEEKYMRFPQGLAKAATFSYDDGVAADERLLRVFEKYDLKGTFNLNSQLFQAQCWHGRMDEETTYKLFVSSGQEVAVHGARHTFLNKVPLAEAIKEIVDCREYLEDKFNRLVRGMAYAYNSYNDEVVKILPSLGIDYARTTQSTHSFALPGNWLLWHPTCKHTDKQLLPLAEQFLAQSPANAPKHRESLLFYVWGHSFEFDDDGNWEVIEDLGKRLSKAGDVWFATNGEICSYVKAYDSLIYSLDGERAHNPTATDVWIELRGKVYKIAAGETIQFDKAKRII